ncbi:hypothetical protein [Amycolatopsis sp.]|uniref:hypothetical protein n=1 Tax=Amycolatopsis sp. TaxID=37632 RepID=UPI002BDBAE27|nr:hypothetical protein [Amycolatopsis sp.]HVV09479.1 hypothetical protein [Amycolatopsis sp.]
MLEYLGLLDFAQLWTLIVSAVVELGAFAFLATHRSWVSPGVAAAAVAVAWLILLRTIRRPAMGTRRADLALRHRSARVALGIATAAMTCRRVDDIVAFLAFAISIAAILAIASASSLAAVPERAQPRGDPGPASVGTPSVEGRLRSSTRDGRSSDRRGQLTP